MAEYKWKQDGCGAIAAGQVCALDAAGKVTDKWSQLVHPRVKSGAGGIQPAVTMGDVWGSPSAICVSDNQPLGEAPEDTTALAAFQVRLEANRQAVDRLAYCGTVYVRNEDRDGAAAQSGDFIVLCEGTNDAIQWQAVSAIASFEQLALCIGRVERLAGDGAPLIAVKI